MRVITVLLLLLMTVGCASGRIQQSALQTGLTVPEVKELAAIAKTKYRKPFVRLSKEDDGYRVMLGDRSGGTYVTFKKERSKWIEIATGPWWAD